MKIETGLPVTRLHVGVSHPGYIMRTRGFSLVELMAGLAVGLLAMLAVFQVFSFASAQSRTTSAAADSQQSGALSLYLLERELRQAGYGFNLEEAMGCTVRAQNSAGAFTFTLSPVMIQSGGAVGNDTVTVIHGSGDRPVWSPLFSPYNGDATPISVMNSYGFQPNDFAIVVGPTTDCTMMRITGIVGNDLAHGTNAHNSSSPGVVYNIAGSGAGIQASVVSLGSSPVISQYSVQSSKLMVTDLLEGGAATLYADNVVAFKAQYGFNLCGAANASGDVVTQYSDTMIDADGDGTVGNRGDWARIKAVRIGILARGTQYERDVVSPANIALWPTSTTSPTTTGPVISLNATQQHYRYSVFSTVIPIRNMLWSRGMQWSALQKCN